MRCCASAEKKGFIALKAKGRVRILPALNIHMELIDRGLEIFRSVVEE